MEKNSAKGRLNFILNLAKRIKFILVCRAAKHWLLYSTLIRVASPLHRRLLVNATETELVIEGFPRSGNTFAVVAFESAQDHPVNIAHHVHAQCQVIRAAELNIPICILIRSPIDAIKSSVVMSPHLTPTLLLRKYIQFYGDILRVRDSIVVADFDEVKSDFGNVIERINKRFCKSYQYFEHSEENISQVYKQISHINKIISCGHVYNISIPHPQKENAKLTILFNEDEQLLLTQANEIYKVYCDGITNYAA